MNELVNELDSELENENMKNDNNKNKMIKTNKNFHLSKGQKVISHLPVITYCSQSRLTCFS